MNVYAYIALIPALVYISCNQPAAEVVSLTVPVDSLYQVDIPSNLKPGYDMHAYASLQYYDTLQNFYLLGIEDHKQNLGDIKRKRLKIKGYYDFVESTVLEKADSFQIEADQQMILAADLTMKSSDYYVLSRINQTSLDLFYRIAVYENEDYFFQLVFWLPYEGYCREMPWIDEVTESFTFIGEVSGS